MKRKQKRIFIYFGVDRRML